MRESHAGGGRASGEQLRFGGVGLSETGIDESRSQSLMTSQPIDNLKSAGGAGSGGWPR
jgi:hypothetical protein